MWVFFCVHCPSVCYDNQIVVCMHWFWNASIFCYCFPMCLLWVCKSHFIFVTFVHIKINIMWWYDTKFVSKALFRFQKMAQNPNYFCYSLMLMDILNDNITQQSSKKLFKQLPCWGRTKSKFQPLLFLRSHNCTISTFAHIYI